MTDVDQPRWSSPVADLNDFRDRTTRIERPFHDFPRTEGRLHAVLGGARMGKTSLLNVLPAWLGQEPVRRGQHLVPTLIHLEPGDLETPQGFLLRVVKRLREGLRELGLCTIAERNFEPFFEDRSPVEGFRDALSFLLEQARQASSEEGRPLRDVRLIGLVDDADEVARLSWASDLFRDLRDLYAHVEMVRRCLDLVLTGEDSLARQFESGTPWAARGCLSLCPLTPEAISTWLQDTSEGQLATPLAQAISAESGGHPFLIRYFIHEIRRQAERRGWDHLPSDMTDRLAVRFIQQQQDTLAGWALSLRQADTHDVTWTTYSLLAEAGDAGLRDVDVEDKLWDLGLQTDVEQTLRRLVWQGVVSPVPDKPHRFVAKGVFRRYYQQQPALEPLPGPPIQPISEIMPPRPCRTTLDYDAFVVRLSAENDHYRVRVKSRWGEASDKFHNPFSHGEQESMWQNVALQGRRRDVIRPQPQAVRASEKMEAIGGQLFRAVFHDEVLARFRSAWENANRERLGLRVQLILEPPELHGLPWEFLYDNESPLEFLALSRNTPLVRYVEQPTPVTNFRQLERLRLLFVVARPVKLPALNLDREMNDICTALEDLQKQGRVEYTIVQGCDANTDNLQQTLQEDYHVFHFLGHGAFDETSGEGILLLEGADGRGEPLTARRLARLLRDQLDVRLAFLNACETARATETSPFASVAGALVRFDVPGVVATQYAISDRAAVSFARKFYQALAEGYPLEAAVAEGRKAIDLSEKNYEWGVPVLYLRAQDGRVFQ